MSKLSEIRVLFDARLKKGVPDPPGAFDPRDLERVKSDKYLYRILEHHDNNVQAAVDMLWEIMVWRKTEKINEISEKTVNLEYLKEGLFFPRGRDIDSCLLFIMKSKLYVKGQKNIADVKRVIIYWLERLEREEDGKKLTIFFDMEGCGLSNMELEIIMYMVTLFKTYYPNFVNYLIVYQLPWILSAGFKLVRGILPAAAIERLKTVNKDKLKELVATEQALKCWGGKDDYVFEFVPENRNNAEPNTKKVTFKDNGNTHSLGEMLSLSTSVVDFNIVGEEISGEFTITNMEDSAVSFKIRTTSPDKYRVRPSSGILATSASQTIQIVVQPGFNINCVNKDRFLVLVIQIPKVDMSQNEVNEIWQNSSKSKVDEYRLRCQSFQKESLSALSAKSQEFEPIASVIKEIEKNNQLLYKNIKMLKIYQYVTIFLTLIVIIFGILLYQKVGNVDGYCSQI